MGFRNPFRFAVDDATGNVFLGDYGPDASAANPERGPAGQVEFNLIKQAGNFGWPYCHGRNDAYNDYDFATNVSGAKFSCSSPTNDSPRNTGLSQLPAAQPATIAYDNCSVPEFGCGSESPMGGPTYRFDPAGPETKFPAAFDGMQFAYEWGRGWIKALSFDASGTMTSAIPVMDSYDFKQPISVEFGPDGSLYVLDYGTGYFAGDQNSAVYRIDYVQGSRSPVAVAESDVTSGAAPLQVSFSSAGSVDPDGTAISYAWDFQSDGQVDSTEANPVHTYTAEGAHTASLTVTDESGKTGSASINITVGNTAPTLKIVVPGNGATFDYGDTIPWKVEVTDPEDASIDCADVHLDTALGHNDHAHGHQNLTGCSGTVTVPPAWEGLDQESTFVLTASYTDHAVPGLELTGSTQVRLENRILQAEFADALEGLQVVSHGDAQGGKRVGYVDGGDWLRYDDINLSGIDRFSARTLGTDTSGVELRRGSPSGQLLARLPVTSSGSWETYKEMAAVPVIDPGGTFDLYVVFTGGGMDLDSITFGGGGSAGNASPQTDPVVEPRSGVVPLTVDFRANASDPEGTPVTLDWDFGTEGATATGQQATYTYQRRGSYTATLTATDGDGRRTVRTFDITVQPNCPTGAPAPSDEFDGSELDACRWTVLREDPAHYRLAGGALQIDALPGDMLSGDASARNLVLQTAPDGPWEAVTKVSLPKGDDFSQAGLLVHGTDKDYAKLHLVDVPQLGWRVEMVQNVNGRAVFDPSLDRSTALPEGINESGIWLRLRSTGTSVGGAWSADGSTWHSLGRTSSMSRIADPRVGLGAYNGTGQVAGFDFFHLDQDVEPSCTTPVTPDEGYQMLFDGTAQSLATWKMAGPGSFELQEDCSLLTVGGTGLLHHPDPLESYSLKLDWKMAGDDNGGVFVGFPDPMGDVSRAINGGHEVQIDGTDAPDSTTGAVYKQQSPVTATRDEVLNPPGQWNSYELIVEGDRIRVLLKGTVINDFTNTDQNRMNAPSFVGLQNHGDGDEIFYRNVQVKPLPTPTGTAPTVDIAAPANGSVVDTTTVELTGSTTAERVDLRIGERLVETTVSGGTFRADVPLDLGRNLITVIAIDDSGLTATKQITVIARAYGDRVGGFDDPLGDDDGPGTYTYPTDSAYAPGGFDLVGMDVYTQGDQVRFVTEVGGAVVNPWGGDKISHQRINIYLGGGDAGAAPALPGTNMDTASPWSRVVVIDGRFDTAGVYGPDGNRLAKGTLFAIPQNREIGISVPVSALGELGLGDARFGVAMFGNAEAGEGIGYVRPVYDYNYWNAADPWWVKAHRFGGGAGVLNDAPAHDSDTRDPNALDVIVGCEQSQQQVLDWTKASPTQLPMLGLGGTEETDTTGPDVEVSGVEEGKAYGDSTSLGIGWTTCDSGSGVEKVTATLDGQPLESGERVSLWLLDLGAHQVEVTATDRAGNQTVRRITFTTVTSPADLRALLDRFRQTGALNWADHRRLERLLDEAIQLADSGRKRLAADKMSRFITEAKRIQDPVAQRVLVRDGEVVRLAWLR